MHNRFVLFSVLQETWATYLRYESKIEMVIFYFNHKRLFWTEIKNKLIE